MRQPATPIMREHAPIQAHTVRAALNTLLYSAAVQRWTPLAQLWLVDAYLLDPENPLSPDERLLALQTILIDLITQEIARHRGATRRSAPTLADDLPTALADINADARSEHIELIAWSWLYYRYVRVDLHLTPPLFCQHAHCDERTRRRYHVHGMRRLTERLIEQERAARRTLRKHRLYAELPTPFTTPLFGRAELLNGVHKLFEKNAPLLIQVSGEAGIGKTAFVAELLRGEIDAGHVSDVIWIERPTSCSAVLEIVKRRLPPDALTLGNPFAAGRGIIVILDDLTLLAADIPTLNRLLTGLAPITVCLIHYVTLPIAPVSVHVRLDGLPLLETSALIRWLEGRSARSLKGVELSEAEIIALWELTRGNPAALLRAFDALLRDE